MKWILLHKSSKVSLKSVIKQAEQVRMWFGQMFRPLLFHLKKTQCATTAFHQTIICARLAKMTSLALVLVFCAFVSLSDSACFRTLPKRGAKHCTDDETKHPFGSTWTTSKCMRCTCSYSGMECCDMMGRIIQTEGCTVEYDYSTCTFEVFHPEDPTIRCSYVAVGK